MDYLFIFFAVAIFIAVVLLVEGLYVSWNSSRGPEAKRIARRLRIMSAGAQSGQEDVSILKKRLLSDAPAMQRLLQQFVRLHSLDRLLEQSGLTLNVSQFCLASLACGGAVFALLLFVSGQLFVSLVLGLAAIGLPLLLVMGKKRKRLARIEEQLPAALDLMSRALRAGHAFSSALQMVGDEMPDPIGSEFRTVFDEVNYGIPMQDALKSLSTRVPGTDVGYFVVAVLIQRETGGSLAELLGSIASIVRERFKLFGQIKVLSAEGRLSAWILSLLPVGLAAVLQVVNPDFLKVLWTDPIGRQMLGVVAVMMVVGVLWMRKLIRIRV
ncbi:type II secretion system F family protein [Paraherbaspirillum soli]|uniref:Type II secretion system F family protein n=1 Tax=Paraherbaspirillum soli TaxID=631222 RepID=A0ABW0MDY7_9BURK